ncbi:MAG: sigma-70 family RNA polymerase sigma factor [Anaerolineae bacterium]|jgi:RNA polymerase sigma-70 factor (ECF subfamily)
MDSDDKFWIARARQGDDAAFAQLVELYQRPVFNLCHRMLGDPGEAEDATQETFIRAYTRLATYDPNRKFSSWLLSIASHYCIDQLRRRRLGLLSWDNLLPSHWLFDPRPGPEEVALSREAQRDVREMLNSLPPDYRAALILRYWHELSYKEIAEALNSTAPAIKSRLFRARQMMAQAITQPEATPTRIPSTMASHVEAL